MVRALAALQPTRIVLRQIVAAERDSRRQLTLFDHGDRSMRTQLIFAIGSSCPGSAVGREPALRGGFPTPEASQKTRDAEDFQRAVTACRFWYPTVSCEGIFNGGLELGQKINEDMMILSAGPRHVVFTANSDTPYGSGTFDLRIARSSSNCRRVRSSRLADDHHQRWIMDMGLPGPDARKRGQAPAAAARLQGRGSRAVTTSAVRVRTRCSSPFARCR